MMKLTTPAIASEPYTAEAPPVTTSTRSISAGGMLFRSTTPSVLAPTMRRPLTSTRVREGPRPRRSTVAVPVPGLLLDAPNVPTTCGRVSSTCSTSSDADWRSSSVPTTLTGLLEVRSARGMREPVTVMVSTCTSCASAACAASVAAIATLSRRDRLAPQRPSIRTSRSLAIAPLSPLCRAAAAFADPEGEYLRPHLCDSGHNCIYPGSRPVKCPRADLRGTQRQRTAPATQRHCACSVMARGARSNDHRLCASGTDARQSRLEPGVAAGARRQQRCSAEDPGGVAGADPG